MRSERGRAPHTAGPEISRMVAVCVPRPSTHVTRMDSPGPCRWMAGPSSSVEPTFSPLIAVITEFPDTTCKGAAGSKKKSRHEEGPGRPDGRLPADQ